MGSVKGWSIGSTTRRNWIFWSFENIFYIESLKIDKKKGYIIWGHFLDQCRNRYVGTLKGLQWVASGMSGRDDSSFHEQLDSFRLLKGYLVQFGDWSSKNLSQGEGSPGD